MKRTPKQPDKKETIPVKHSFTDEELAALARKQGLLYQEQNALESQKSHTAKDYAARIEGVESQLDEISNKTASGFEMRPTECAVFMRPKDKLKDYHRLDTFEFIETRTMQTSDYQAALPLDTDDTDGNEEPPKAAA